MINLPDLRPCNPLIHLRTRPPGTYSTIPTTKAPRFLALTPDSRKLYATGGDIYVIDTASRKEVKTIPIDVSVFGGGVRELVVSPNGERVYQVMSAVHENQLNGVFVIDVASDEIIASIRLPDGFYGDQYGALCIAIAPDGARVYVTIRGRHTIEVVDTETNTHLRSISLQNKGGGRYPNPIKIAITPDGSRAYTVDRGNRTGKTQVFVVDTSTEAITKVIPLSGIGPARSWAFISITPDGSRAYVTVLDGAIAFPKLAVIDTDPASPTFHQQIGLVATSGSHPLNSAITPDGKQLLLVERNSNRTLVIDIDPDSPTFHTEIGSVDVGEDPWDVIIRATSGGLIAYVGPSAAHAVYILASEVIKPLIVDAGDDQSVECTAAADTSVMLDGSGSSGNDPLTFAWTGPFPENNGSVTGPKPTVTLPLGAHTITLTVEDIYNNTDTDTVQITVEDTTAPEVTAALAPLAPNSDQDDALARIWSRVLTFICKILGVQRGRYRVECTASDTCDAEPSVTAVIGTPTLNQPTLVFKPGTEKKLVFYRALNTVKVKGPDPQAFWAQVQADGGVAVVNAQELMLNLDEKERRKVVYCFDASGKLEEVGRGQVRLQCTARDASGNERTVEVKPPLRNEERLSEDIGTQALDGGPITRESKSQPSTVIFTDDFDDGILDPAWIITFEHANAWDFDESVTEPSSLTVRNITGATSLAELWRHVLLSRAIPAIGDFHVAMRIAWKSDAPPENPTNPIERASQKLMFGVFDGSGNPIVTQAGFSDPWQLRSGSKNFHSPSSGFMSGHNTLPFSGSALVEIDRLGSTLTFSWDSTLLYSTDGSTEDAETITLSFWGFDPHEGRLGFPWHIGTLSIDQIRVEGILASEPPVADSGDDQSIECTAASTSVMLDGSGSSGNDPLTFAWTGPFPEGNGSVTGPTPTVTLPLGAHTITLTVEDIYNKTGTDTVQITVEDTTAPEIFAAFVPLALNSDQDNALARIWSLVLTLIYQILGAQRGRYRVECTASDTCDAEPSVTAVIGTPTLNQPTLVLKPSTQKKLVFNRARNTIKVEGPDPQAFWTQVQSDGGVVVVNDQKLMLIIDEKERRKVVYCFDASGDLEEVGRGQVRLRCTARDASGNEGAAEVKLPLAE